MTHLRARSPHGVVIERENSKLQVAITCITSLPTAIARRISRGRRKTLHLLNRLANRIGLRRSFGLNGLDHRLTDFLGHQRNGFFIEAGANDGICQSNTLYFERYLGWRGLLVEPIPVLAQRCRLNRPTAIVENAALVPFDFVGETIEMRYCNLMSLVKGAMHSSEEEAKHLSSGALIQNIETFDISVPARTLQSVLDEHAIMAADLFVLDVEGFEAQVLSGINYDRFVAHNLLIEARYRNDVATSRSLSFLIMTFFIDR
jgi:FkbM family methyltransferase